MNKKLFDSFLNEKVVCPNCDDGDKKILLEIEDALDGTPEGIKLYHCLECKEAWTYIVDIQLLMHSTKAINLMKNYKI
jgi:hypothetical protein